MTDDYEPPVHDDDIEGLGEEEDAGWGDYPIDTVLIRNETRTVHDVLRRIEQGSYIMTPDFQREFIWKDAQQSKLIESVLMRIPLPVFYLAEDAEGRMIVVDGLQRLSTFRRFVENDLPLRLPDQAELHRKRFQDLSAKLQNRIEDCNLILYVIDGRVPERARLDIFERVNSGVPLTRQQMRNCIYNGPATQFLKTEATTDLFIEATGRSLKPEPMRDREFVNRFCAFQVLPLSEYRGDMDEYLAKVLTTMNAMSDHELQQLSMRFRNSMTNNLVVFDKHAFRKPPDTEDRRKPINASLWDIMSTGLSRFTEDEVIAGAERLQEGFAGLLADEQFSRAITLGTNQVDSVNTRFGAFAELLKEVFGATRA